MVSMGRGSGAEVPQVTRQVALAAFPKGCLAMRVRDELGPLFDDEVFRSALVSGGVLVSRRDSWPLSASCSSPRT